MGNSLRGASLLSDVHYFPYHVQLGRYAAIAVTKTDYKKKEDGGGHNMEWKVSYTVNGSTCQLELERLLDREDRFNVARIALHDDICSGGGFHFQVRKAETNLLEVCDYSFCGTFDSMSWNKLNTTTHASGGVTETLVLVYGNGSKGGLLVVEWKKKSGDQQPYMATVAHYYATVSGNLFDQTKIDIGLSVIARIRVSSYGSLDVTVEGPEQHPAAALFYMFDEVKRTGNWKPTACPHCAKIQKQRTGMFGQSESEDSDNFPPAGRLHGPRPNAGGVIANDAPVRGNYNGSFFVRQLFLRR